MELLVGEQEICGLIGDWLVNVVEMRFWQSIPTELIIVEGVTAVIETLVGCQFGGGEKLPRAFKGCQ